MAWAARQWVPTPMRVHTANFTLTVLFCSCAGVWIYLCRPEGPLIIAWYMRVGS